MRGCMHWCGFALAAARILLAPEPLAARQLDGALAVPYVAQSEALCGGAASAMVLRYWGTRGVNAEDFVSLLNARRDGIETGALVDALIERGWRALAFTGTTASVAGHLAEQRPVVALIAIAPRRFHYVVVLAITDTHVVYHDPAGRPSQIMTLADFDRAWSASSRWSLLVLPGDGVARSHVPVPSPSPALPDACRQELLQAASAAGRQEFDRAEQLIEAARLACPSDAAPLRELAGLRLLQRRTADAVPLARAAVAHDASDRHAWRVLGTAEFLERDQPAALDAWNRVGEPVTDLIRVAGLARTRHRVVTDRMGLLPGTLLTAADLGRARRRLSELPAGSVSRVDVAPVGGGLVEIHAAVFERPLMPTTPLALGTLGVRALTNREATWRLSSPTGAGERLDVTARWWESRPAAAVALSLPLRSRLISGVLRLEGGFARESYRSETGGAVSEVDDRRSALVGLSDWATANLRWDVTTRADRWSDGPVTLGVGGALERHVGSAAAIRLQGDVWPASGFGVGSLGARWRWTA